MEIAEFINATSRLETYFGKDYTENQRAIMFESLGSWSIDKYRKAVKYCIENCKTLPKIVDFRQIEQNNRPAYDDVKEMEAEFTSCKMCCDGFVEYKKIYDGFSYSYLALCTCKNGQIQRERGYNFKTIADLKINAIAGRTLQKGSKQNEIKATINNPSLLKSWVK